jgi:hypothetical protein
MPNDKIKAYVYFFEDYLDLSIEMAKSMERKYGADNVSITGIAARRSTACDKIERNRPVSLKSYDWLGELEQEWLSTPYDEDRIRKYEKMLGTQKLRHLIYCDREFGFGFMTGGIYAQTPMRKIIENDHERRWRYILGMLDYYFETFKREKPDFVFFSEYTMNYELAAYYVAEYLGIPAFCLYWTRAGRSFVMNDNPYIETKDIHELFKKSAKNKNLVPAENLKAAKDEFNAYINKPEPTIDQPIFRQKMLAQASPLSMVKTLIIDTIKWGAISLGLFGTKGFLRQRSGLDMLLTNLKVFIESNKAQLNIGYEQAAPLMERNYIYFPLHYEPEATTLVLSPQVTDQLNIIQQIAKNMPAGYKLIVKEHVPMIGNRPRGFYDKIRTLPDVHLVSPFADNFSIIKNAKLIATITGSTAWEGIMLKVPSLLLARTDFDIINEGFMIDNDMQNLENTLIKAMKVKPAKDENIVRLIASARTCGVHLPYNAYYAAHLPKKDRLKMADYPEHVDALMEQIYKRSVKAA